MSAENIRYLVGMNERTVQCITEMTQANDKRTDFFHGQLSALQDRHKWLERCVDDHQKGSEQFKETVFSAAKELNDKVEAINKRVLRLEGDKIRARQSNQSL